MVVKLYPHQEKAIEELSNGKILWGDVGTGKSLTAAAYYARKEAPRDVYVITTAKKRDSLDWEKEFSAFAVGKSANATVAGILRVDSWNNIHKYVGVEDAFFIFDEQRLVGTGKWVKSFHKIARGNQWILLTATPGDTWLDYAPVFIANGFYKNITEFKREHVVYNHHAKFPKVDRYVSVGRLVKYRNNLLVHMPYERHTRRITHVEKCTYDIELFDKVVKQRWHVYEERPLRDVSEMFGVMRKVVNSDESRLAALRELTSIHPRVIVFYNFDYELEILRAYLEPIARREQARALLPFASTELNTQSTPNLEESATSKDATDNSKSVVTGSHPSFPDDETAMKNEILIGEQIRTARSRLGSMSAHSPIMGSRSATHQLKGVSIAEWNGHKHQEIPKTDRWVYLVQYVAGAEGWNCTETDCVVFWSLTYSYKNWHQAHGRIDRLNTPFKDLHYYVLKSDSMIDQAVWKSLKGKQSFNEASFRGKYKF